LLTCYSSDPNNDKLNYWGDMLLELSLYYTIYL